MRSGECSNLCELFTSRLADDVYVCERSGRMHHCTGDTCDALDITAEHRVCRITGITYALDTYVILRSYDLADFGRKESAVIDVDALDAGGLDVDDGEVVAIASTDDTSSSNGHVKTETVKPETSDNNDQIQMVEETASDLISPRDTLLPSPHEQQQELPTPPPPHTKHKRQTSDSSNGPMRRPRKPVRAEALFCQSRSIIKHLSARLPGKEVHRLSQLCMTLWLRITQTPMYKQEVGGKYRYDNHTLAVLYNSTDGLIVNDNILIQPQPRLINYLPPAKSLRDFGYKPADYTRTCKLLHLLALQVS